MITIIIMGLILKHNWVQNFKYTFYCALLGVLSDLRLLL